MLEYSDRPGDRAHQKRHLAFAPYAVAPFKRKLLLPDGKELMREFKAGDVRGVRQASAPRVPAGENWLVAALFLVRLRGTG